MKKTDPLDVVKRESDFVLYAGSKPLLTPEGDEITHPLARLPQHLLRELARSSSDDESLSALNIFRIRKNLEKQSCDPAVTHWKTLLAMDPLVDKTAFDNATRKNNDHDYVLDLLENQSHLTFFFNGLAIVVQCFNDFLLEFSEGHFDFTTKSPATIAQALLAAYQSLSADQVAATHLLCTCHACGMLLPMMLILGKITAAEYANALFGLHYPQKEEQPPSNTVFHQYLSVLPETSLCLPDWPHAHESFSVLRDQAWTALDYLSCATPAKGLHANLLELIERGENFNTEFKTTLRWNIRAERKDMVIEHAVLKTVNAFLNAAGGTLLVGVRDDGAIEGIQLDAFASEDKYALHFWNLIKASMGQDVSPLIRTTFEEMGDKSVFVVQCSQSPQPVFLHQKGFEEEFFIRVGPSSSRLTVREALKYISGRFEK